MARVGEARAHDAPVAGRDRRAAVGRDEVRDEDELVGEPAPTFSRVMAAPGHDGRRWRLAQHKTFLVGADGGADDLGRQVEERRLEFAHQHDRPFDEAGDFLEQALVLDEREPLRESEILRVGEDDRLAPVGVEHDLGLLQGVDIIVVAADMDRPGRHEAMAPGHVA